MDPPQKRPLSTRIFYLILHHFYTNRDQILAKSMKINSGKLIDFKLPTYKKETEKKKSSPNITIKGKENCDGIQNFKAVCMRS